MRRAIGVVVLAWWCAAPAAHAQDAASRPIRRPEVGASAGWLGGASLGAADAALRGNSPAGDPFRLFAADSSFGATPLLQLRAGLGLTSRVGLEGGLTWSGPEIRTAVGNDIEGAPGLTLRERVSQYFFDATVVVAIDEWSVGGRLVPFAAGGAGYLRQLHEGRTVVEHGQVFHAGGGVKYWIMTRQTGRLRASGIRGDVRAYFTRGGVSYESGPRPRVAVSGGMFLAF